MSRGQAPAASIPMSQMQQNILKEIVSKYTTAQQKAKRANILLLANQGYSNSYVKREIGVALNTVKQWRTRWLQAQASLAKFENYVELEQASILEYKQEIFKVLQDKARSGSPKRITLSQEQQIIALACEEPIDFQIEMTNWTHEMLAHVAISKGIVSSISSRQVGRVLKK